MIKKKAAVCFLKRVGSTVLGMVFKAKSLAVVRNSRTGLLMKTRLLLLPELLPNKKLLTTAISDRMHAVMASAGRNKQAPRFAAECFVDEEDEYPDLTHCLFNLEEEEDEEEKEEEEEGAVGNACSAVELNLEDEIDHAADVFIRRFRRQMRSAEARIS